MRKGKNSLEMFMIDVLASLLVTEQNDKGKLCIVLDNWAPNDEDREFLYVRPEDFLKTISKLRRERREISVGVKGVDGYAAKFMDVRDDRFLEYILATISGECRAYFQPIYDAKPPTTRKSTPKTQSSSKSNVVPFPHKKGRKGRR